MHHTATVKTPSPAAMGRSKKAGRLPSALIIEVMKLRSSMGPSTRPRIAGAMGMSFSSIRKPTTPKISIRITPNTVLLMAKEPTMQKVRMIGISTLWGIDRIVRAALIATQPKGSMMRFARRNTMNTA